jgi:phosphoribosylanthranilate isomerase
MFQIKICGITNVEDAIAAVDAGADAIGLNFYEKSPRFIAPTLAQQVSQGAGNKVLRVGVFVNHPVTGIAQIRQQVDLDAIQLHGDESPEDFAAVAITHHYIGRVTSKLLTEISQDPDSSARSAMLKLIAEGNRPPVIRARRIDERGPSSIVADLQACLGAGGWPGAILVDALTPGRYGGTGETVSWVGLADHRRWLGDTPLILAGGLTPDNVAEAIRIVRPHGVDVASGVESAPGKKDPHKVRDFIAAARAALDALDALPK